MGLSRHMQVVFAFLRQSLNAPSPKTRDAIGLKRFFTHPHAEDLFVTEAQTMHSGGSRSVFSCKRPSARRLTPQLAFKRIEKLPPCSGCAEIKRTFHNISN